MAYNTKAILTDVNQKPIPQFYDAVSDVYRQLTGQTLGGDNYGSNAVSWGKTAGGLFAPVAVNDSGHVQSVVLSSALPSGAATQTTLAAVLAKLSADPATQTTLAAILAKIIAAPATEAKQDTLIGHVDGVESALASILAKLIAAPATEAKQTALAELIGEVQASPTENTLLARIKALETKIDAIIAGTTPATVQLSGSNAPKSGQKNVTTAGTRVALGSDQEYKKINIIAKSTNTGNIFVGDNTVSTSIGCILPPGGYVTLEFVNTNEIYIDSAVSGEGVSWMGVV